MPFDRQTVCHSPTGAALILRIKDARGPVRAVVQINHGLAEHAARYARFADFLAMRGFAVYAHDHRGHGLTTAPDAPPGRFGTPRGADKVIADVNAIHDRIATDHPGMPVIVFGHSMGGLIALAFALANSRRIHALAVWNANVSGGLLARLAQLILAWETFRLGSDVPSRLMPRLTFQAWGNSIPDARTPFDWLSRDPAEVDAYIADPLCGWNGTVSLWRDIFDFVLRGADDRALAGMRRDLPINLVGGGADPSTDGGGAVDALAGRLRQIGFADVVATVYPHTRHESLNEINRDAIMQDFAAWLDHVLANDSLSDKHTHPR